MHRAGFCAGCCGSGSHKVDKELVGVEWRIWSHKAGYRHQAGVEGLICSQFVGRHPSTPETLAVEAHIPVGEIVADKFTDFTGTFCKVIIVQSGLHILNQGVEQRENPTVDFRTLCHRNLRFGASKSVDIGIERHEGVCVVDCGEELARRLLHTLVVEFQVIPRRRVGNHIPAHRVGAIGLDCIKRIHGVAETL